MDWKQFVDAVKQGANVGAPSSAIPELGNAMRGAFRSSALGTASRAMGVTAQQNADDEEKRAAAAREARAREIQDMLDPSKYIKQRKDDGGFAFFDPKGKEIDVDTYAKRTGQRRVDVLADSENPVDLQFIDDYKQMNDLNQAIWRNDTGALAEYKALYPDLFKGGTKPEDLNRKLLEKYPHIFGMGNYGT